TRYKFFYKIKSKNVGKPYFENLKSYGYTKLVYILFLNKITNILPTVPKKFNIGHRFQKHW
ncbi:hypothetical protein PpBr36_01470, partial [Pyricularia pennisetigena]|uniref:hypothetical protein n=1 Tax=Pyricularia pennisetigena TaxID=1578925 RepID=UPI00114DD779